MKQNFEKNDFVRLTEKAFNTYAKNTIWAENIFTILSKDGDHFRLSDIDETIPQSAIEPIPIDGISDACIYYDPLLAANFVISGENIPTHHKDTSYYIDGFSKMHIEDHTLKDEFDMLGFKYVHEVQQWLRPSHTLESLKVNYTLK